MTSRPGSLATAEAQARLARFIAKAAAATAVEIAAVAPLRGGAIQENWRLDVEISGGPKAGAHALVLRTDAPSRVAASLGRAKEFQLLRVAHAAGVTVPEPLWLCTDPAVLGRDFMVMGRLPGIAAGHRIVRDRAVGGDRDALAERLGRELARIHAITPATHGAPAMDLSLAFLGAPPSAPALASVALYRRYLDDLGEARPALEWGLRHLELQPPPTSAITLVHQDFRTGNYLADENGLTGILDWEFCAWGDPMADIGWFCAKCWRFGATDREAGGIATRTPFYRGYEAASGRRIDEAAVRYWEIMAHLRWSAIALQQLHRHLAGRQASLELALTGRILPELELEILALVDAAEGRAMRAA